MSDKTIYQNPEGPYMAYLKATTEKEELHEWFSNHEVSGMISFDPDEPLHVADIGCGTGTTSKILIREVGYTKANEIIYFAVDPVAEQLAVMKKLIATDRGMPKGLKLRQHVGDVNTYNPGKQHLTFIGHALYYARDLRATIQRFAEASDVLIMVTHGERGIHALQRRYHEILPENRKALITDKDVERYSDHLRQGDVVKRMEHHRFSCEVDVSSCQDPESMDGQDLISFFFERDYEEIDAKTLESIRRFLLHEYGGGINNFMTHDIGVTVLYR